MGTAPLNTLLLPISSAMHHFAPANSGICFCVCNFSLADIPILGLYSEKKIYSGRLLKYALNFKSLKTLGLKHLLKVKRRLKCFSKLRPCLEYLPLSI